VVKWRQESEGLRQTIESLEKAKQQAEMKEVRPKNLGEAEIISSGARSYWPRGILMAL